MENSRIIYWIPIFIFTFASIILDIRLLYTIFFKTQSNSYKTFFFRFFGTQTINEIVMVSIYITCQLITRDHILGGQFLFDSNGTIFPELYFYGTHFYFMYVQFVERIPAWILLLSSVLVPILPMIPLVLRARITFHYNLEGSIDLVIPTYSVKQNAIQGMVSTVFATILCSICYIAVITKLARMTTEAHSGRDFKREKMLTIVGFAVFISLCVETVYYIFLATMSGVDSESVDRVRVFFVYPTVLMAFVNPWMLILTNQNMRKRVLGFKASPSTTVDNAVTIRTMATPISVVKSS